MKTLPSVLVVSLALLCQALPATAAEPAVASRPAAVSTLPGTLARKAHRVGVRALDAVDASPSQRRAVEASAARMFASLDALQNEAVSLASDAVEIWTAPHVEGEAVEDLRASTVDLLGAASFPAATFVLEVGQVLTQDQRRALAAAAESELRRLSRRIR